MLLLVDDDEIAVMNVRRAFEKGKIDNPLFLAGDGLEALEMLRGDTIPRDRRLVLLDLNMPRMDGIEFLHELRADPHLQRTAVVVLTTPPLDADGDALSGGAGAASRCGGGAAPEARYVTRSAGSR